MRAAIIGSNIRMEGILNFAVFRQGQPVKTTLNLQFSETKIITQSNYHKRVASPNMRALAESDTKPVADSDNNVGG